MHHSFLEQIVRDISIDSDRFMRTCVLLPTRRACHYFRRELQRAAGEKSAWLPAILSIQDFLYEHTALSIAPDEDLIAMLHHIHRDVTGQDQTVTAFQKWGQMILRDFNEIDAYLIEPDYLFHFVREFKQIENDPVLNKEQVRLLQQFWNTLPAEAVSDVRRQFMETWEALGQIYDRFQETLREEDTAYEGMAYRDLLATLESGETRFRWQEFIVAGFNALSTFEERLFSHLAGGYDTRFFWDSHPDWLTSEGSGPGLFIKRYASLFPDRCNVFIGAAEGHSKKKVEVTELPLATAQPEYALQLAENWGADETAIVLCDESLALPLLFHLPQGEAANFKANLTMGYPAAMTSLMALVKAAAELQAYWRSSGRISPVLMLKMLDSPGVASLLQREKLDELKSRIINWGFINKKDVEELFGPEHPLFHVLFKPVPEEDPGFDHTGFSALQEIVAQVPAVPGDDKTAQVVKETVLSELETLGIWAEAHGLVFKPAEWWQAVRNGLYGLKAPFEEPEGPALQVMGFLETRNLDFKNVIIVGADDASLPGNSRHSSFIPYTIKRALELPTHREHDAIYSYHFFRLLLRAENIALLYAPATGSSAKGRSRFVEQILYEWRSDDHIQLEEKHIPIPVPASGAHEPVSIPKDGPAAREAFGQYLSGDRQFSASALSTYIRCPFQFYLKYIAGLDEPEAFTEDYDQRDLGRIFHKGMELFYKPFAETGELITGESLKKHLRQADLDRIIEQAYVEESYSLRPGGLAALKGQNFLVNSVIRELMDKVIEKDMDSAPFRIAGLERRLADIQLTLEDGRTVRLKGFLDRVDAVEGGPEGRFIRIVDYKTGDARMYSARKNQSPEAYFRGYFENSRYKEGFQGYLYAWMYRQIEAAPLKAAFYSARRINEGLRYLNGEQVIDRERLDVFEGFLKQLISEILDSAVDFRQSDKSDAYQYSAYEVFVD